jgi:hypothetical protein
MQHERDRPMKLHGFLNHGFLFSKKMALHLAMQRHG